MSSFSAPPGGEEWNPLSHDSWHFKMFHNICKCVSYQMVWLNHWQVGIFESFYGRTFLEHQLVTHNHTTKSSQGVAECVIIYVLLPYWKSQADSRSKGCSWRQAFQEILFFCFKQWVKLGNIISQESLLHACCCKNGSSFSWLGGQSVRQPANQPVNPPSPRSNSWMQVR